LSFFVFQKQERNESEANIVMLGLIQFSLFLPSKLKSDTYCNLSCNYGIIDWSFKEPHDLKEMYDTEKAKHMIIYTLIKLAKDKSHMIVGCEKSLYKDRLCPNCFYDWLYHYKKFIPCLECSIILKKIEEENITHDGCLNCSENRAIQAYNWFALYIDTLNHKLIFKDKELVNKFKEFANMFSAILLYEMEKIENVKALI
jgi:hypothetical protein